MEQELERLEGTVEDIIYLNEDNGYTVFEVSGGGVVTVVCGVVGELHAGESVVCRGRYENHATYGRQFHAQECETDMPKDLEAVYAFLASRSLPYIGARTADKIIDKFGAAALEMIANDPAQLTLIPGISADKADRIQQEFKRMFGMRELIAYLAQFEISPAGRWKSSAPSGRGPCRPSSRTPTCSAGSRCSWTSATPTASPSITRWQGTAPSGWKPPFCAPCATTPATATPVCPGRSCWKRRRTSSTSPPKAGGGAGQLHPDRETGGADVRRNTVYLSAGSAGCRAGHRRPSGHADQARKADGPRPRQEHPDPGTGAGLCLCAAPEGSHP